MFDPQEVESKSKSRYDLTNALEEVLEKKTERVEKPTATDEERKMCNEKINKEFVRVIMRYLK